MENMDSMDFESAAQSIKPPTMFQIYFDKMIRDMRFVGMFAIIYGAITCLSIIGAIIGVPVIFIGMRIREAADQFSIFKSTNNAAALRAGFELQGKYFNILKILIIIQIALIVLAIVFIIAFFSFFMASVMESSIS
ncbi:MAG: hypothetical protein CVV24_00775 [Ignavibacteriae bacterium HGW-Ignavibacteriae-3]|nr:MAG: hypothetical protein CVV24_00775 [Ignavibacteriae bacterium HGW-Ignavibacteriae-3]